LKIVYIINSLDIGGAEKKVCNLADKLVKNYNLEVSIISLKNKIKIKPLNKKINIYTLKINKNPINCIFGFLKLINLIKKIHPTIVHSHLYYSNLLSRILKPIFPSLKIISTVHNSIEKNNIITNLLSFTDGFSDLNTTVSQSALEKYLKLGIFKKRKSTYIYNGIEIMNYKFDSKIRKIVREEENINENEFVFLSIARLIKSKGIFDVLNAFKLVNKELKARLILIGDGPLKNDLEAYISNNELRNFIIFKSENTKIKDYLSASDTFLNSSYSEGFSLVSVEALANQIPIIASDIETHREIIGNHALFYPVGNYRFLSGLMHQKVIDKKERLLDSSSVPFKRVVKHFSLDNSVRNWFEAYENIIKN
tara:strand:+ start:135 stop:1235 length:1101 start_codon:yes stop_codon:yes gene_type:complete